ncbi:uncharacterized protein [Lolium perenne]|uniref:uncharacterized protein n=1 Tax=Lolium perenne TaxID=4522 RepID=UPI003A9A5881
MLDCTRGLFHYGILCWHKSIFLAIGFIVFFGTIEALYFLASLIKFKEGAWVPIVLAFFFMMVMCIWHYGTIKKYEVDLQNKVSNLPAFHQVITVSQDLQLQLQQFQEYARNGVPAQTLTASAVGLRQQDRPPPLHQGLPPPLLELQRRQSARGRRREGWEVASPPAWACELHRVARRLQPARGAGLRRHQAARGEGLRRRQAARGAGLRRRQAARRAGLRRRQAARRAGLRRRRAARRAGLRRRQAARRAGLRRRQAERRVDLRRRRGISAASGCAGRRISAVSGRRDPPAGVPRCQAARGAELRRRPGARSAGGNQLQRARERDPPAGERLHGARNSGVVRARDPPAGTSCSEPAQAILGDTIGDALVMISKYKGWKCKSSFTLALRHLIRDGGRSKFPDSIVMMVGDGSSNQQPHPNGFNWAGGAVESALPVTGLNPAAQRYVLPEFGFGRLDSAGS